MPPLNSKNYQGIMEGKKATILKVLRESWKQKVCIEANKFA